MALDTSVIIRLKDRFTAGMKRMREGVGRLRSDFDKVKGSFEMAGHLSLAADGVERLSQQTRTLVEEPIRAAVDFEKAMAGLGARTQTLGTKDFESLRTKAEELGRDTLFSTQQAVEGMDNLAFAGLNAEQIIATIGPTMDLATAGQIDLARAADIATNIMAGMGLESSETQRTMDVLALTANSANTNIGLLGETMKFVAPAADKAGLTLEETAAAAGVLANAGIKGSEGGTALRTMLTKIQAPSAAGKKALRELGVQVQDDEGNLRNFTEILTDLSGALEDVGGARRQEILKDLFEQEAISAANILVDAAGGGGLQELSGKLDEADGSARKFAEVMENTTSGEMEKMRAKVESLKRDIGEELLPVMAQLLEDLKPVVEDIADWVEKNPELVRQLGSFLIKTAAITAALGPLLRALSATSAAIGVLRTALIGAKGLRSATVAATTAVSGKSGLAAALGKAGLVAAAASAGYAIGSLINELGRLTDDEGRTLGREIADTIGQATGQEYYGTEFEGEGNLPAGSKVYASGKVVGPDGKVLREANTEDQSRLEQMKREAQRENDLGLVRRLARNEDTAGIVRGARSGDESRIAKAEAALEARGLTDAQVDRIVLAIQESREQIRVEVEGGAREVDSGPATVGD